VPLSTAASWTASPMSDALYSARLWPKMAKAKLRIGLENHILRWIKSLYHARQPS